jgi:two-component system OmpR family sensor kinase/two-component system sensor histidine kinase BaeS
MNRLRMRLTLAFILVTLLTVATIGLLTQRNVDQQFHRYLAESDIIAQTNVLERLTDFYRGQNSWQGVDQLLATIGPDVKPQPGVPPPRPYPFLLADESGKIVYDERRRHLGETLRANERRGAQVIRVQDTVVGYLWLQTPPPRKLSPSEQRFLSGLRRSFLIAALVAIGLGIFCGTWVSRTLSAPLALLAANARAFAAHDWSHRVPIVTTTQISEVAAVAQAFNEMADSLQHAEGLRRNLMADIAHELRTPLTVLQGNLRAVLDGVYPLELKEITTLYDETRLLSRLVDDLRQLALAEAGQLPWHIQTIEVELLLRTIVEKFTPAADYQGIVLEAEIEPAWPFARGDADRVAQVLNNLVNNALHHTPNGGQIILRAQRQNNHVRVSVQDNGEGIAAEDIPYLFDRFYRADKTRSRHDGGTGLGLSIAKSVVQMMGGEIGVESAPGAGSTFWFTLPLWDDQSNCTSETGPFRTSARRL